MSNEVEVRREQTMCANCGADMLGDYCPACGQARKSPLRHLPALAADAADTVLSLDGRLMHTLPALFLRPGFLSNEYFAGRRVRYIPPFRLAFLLCLLAMFVSHVAVDGATDLVKLRNTNAFDGLDTPAEVQRVLEQQLQGLDSAREAPGVPTPALDAMDRAETLLREAAESRVQELDESKPPAASSSARVAGTGSVSVPVAPKPGPKIGLSIEDSDVSLGPIDWLPDFVNARLHEAEARINENIAALRSNDQAIHQAAINRMLAGTFAALPPAMFLMLPVFAVLLKILYLFRRRLYVEHLIVALHSHAFLFLGVFLLAGLALLGQASADVGWLQVSLGWLQWGLFWWMLVYLLLMQKRVYVQGWALTAFKFLIAGCCYVLLLGLVIVAAFLIGISAA